MGDIICTQTAVITPTGRHPYAGLRWLVEDHAEPPSSWFSHGIPSLVMSRLGRRSSSRDPQRLAGEVHVIVESDDWSHRSVIPVTSLAQVTDIYSQVLLVRSFPGPTPTPAPGVSLGGDELHAAHVHRL